MHFAPRRVAGSLGVGIQLTIHDMWAHPPPEGAGRLLAPPEEAGPLEAPPNTHINKVQITCIDHNL